MSADDRRPYVEDDPDPANAARRSANIDRSEADGYDYDDPRRARALESAERWDAQAERATPPPPTVHGCGEPECDELATRQQYADTTVAEFTADPWAESQYDLRCPTHAGPDSWPIEGSS